MKIPTIDGFLWFDLETTGIIFGWFGVITGAIGAILATVATIFVYVLTCGKLMRNEIFRNLLEEFSISNCSDLNIVLVPFGFFCLIAAFVYWGLLKGIHTLDHVKILPAVYLFCVEALYITTSHLELYTGAEIFETVIIGAVMIYILLAIYSLYVKVRDDYQGRVIIGDSDA